MDPRIEKLAQFMQQRDARIFEVQDRHGNFQSWEGIGEMGREEYMKDAEAYVKAMDIINANTPKTEQVELTEYYCGRLLSHSNHRWISGASGYEFQCPGDKP